MSNRYLSDGAISAGKFVTGITSLNIFLSMPNLKKRPCDKEGNDDEGNIITDQRPKIVFTPEAIDALRMSQAGFIARLGSEIDSALTDGKGGKRLTKEHGNKSSAQSEDEKVRTVHTKVVESSLKKIGMCHNLDRCRDNFQYWKQKETKRQIEDTSGNKSSPNVEPCIDGAQNPPTALVDGKIAQKADLTARKRRERIKRKKMKNAFKKGNNAEDLLAEQERLFAKSAAKAMENRNQNF
mmetsp:Transcript_19837/g.19067  ORF Transcript_19837/g.19067 Transcript_19837/m.19067 type:complete len:239 (-) Transcript_19837:304-1020(-)|eukprot:CAMPEP_0197832646 /NCGR_PEP_ID=MMETSP1437-20131217/15366_1 /TAXON_ID=49252 ORGANISM="Eucampia antarctica, Strain CCMP1452" /NCGR_SAMPLE_ID=MMETSP1437 /ASSEMBLY_ACC=CAM_ASM_001096 /LENGTH=238 /DNA_ID=CAMNT_0043436105 /DNA_START=133 /DNA_END=849 /DNA_ORIENTATION=+